MSSLILPWSVLITIWFAGYALTLYLLGLIGIQLLPATILYFTLTILTILNINLKPPKPNRLQVLVTILLTLILASFTFTQRLHPEEGLLISKLNHHDALWHTALMLQIQKQIPPQHPLLAGETIQGYHYGLDLINAGLSQITAIPAIVWYLNFAPLLFTALWVATTLTLFLTLIRNKTLAYLGAITTLLGASLNYLLPLFFPIKHALHSTLWIDVPSGLIINQQQILAFSLVNAIILAIYHRPKYLGYILPLLIGALVIIKVYALVIILAGLWTLVVYQFIRTRSTTYATPTLISTIVSGLLLLTNPSPYGFPFFLLPGWFISAMFPSEDKLNFATWELQRLHLVATGNYPRLILLWAFAAFIFFVGNFHLKLLGLFTAIILLFKTSYQAVSKHSVVIILFIATLIGLILPMLILQKGTVWNTIQFIYFAPAMLTLLLFMFLDTLRTKWKIWFGLAVLLISLPTSLERIYDTLQPEEIAFHPPQTIRSLLEIDAVPEDINLIAHPELDNNELNLITAISGKALWWGDTFQYTVTGQFEKSREEYVMDIIDGEPKCQDNFRILTQPGHEFIVETCHF